MGPFTYDVTAFFVIFDPLLPPCHYVSLFLNPLLIMTSFLDTPPLFNAIFVKTVCMDQMKDGTKFGNNFDKW